MLNTVQIKVQPDSRLIVWVQVIPVLSSPQQHYIFLTGLKHVTCRSRGQLLIVVYHHLAILSIIDCSQRVKSIQIGGPRGISEI